MRRLWLWLLLVATGVMIVRTSGWVALLVYGLGAGLLALSVLMVWWVHKDATQRGMRHPGIWAFLSWFFPLFAVPLYFALRPRKASAKETLLLPEQRSSPNPVLGHHPDYVRAVRAGRVWNRCIWCQKPYQVHDLDDRGFDSDECKRNYEEYLEALGSGMD